MSRRLIDRFIEQCPSAGTGSEDDIGVWAGAIRCWAIDAIFWQYRGKRLPGRAAKAVRRAEKKYQNQERHHANS